jgi:hypothetical protein
MRDLRAKHSRSSAGASGSICALSGQIRHPEQNKNQTMSQNVIASGKLWKGGKDSNFETFR